MLNVNIVRISDNFIRKKYRNKVESPYKPETTLLCVRSRSKNVIALIIAPKE